MRANPNDSLRSVPTSWVKAGENVTITIGRNVGGDPLTDQGWADFQATVIDHVSALVQPERAFTYTGLGEWDGTVEESAAILLVNTRYTTDAAHVERVLANLAESYGQECIAFSHSPVTLAGLRSAALV